MRMIPLPLPSLLEQQKIAEILSTVDDAIQKTNEIIAKTERLKKGLMHELLTKGIGHKEFKDTEIGRIPKDWEVVKLGEITTKIKDIDHKMPRKQKTGIPFISIKCMLKYPDLNFYLDPNDPDLEFISKKDYEYHVQRFNVEMNDIIYSRFGSIGNAKLVTTEQHFIASYSIVLIKPNIHKVNPTFLTCVLNSEIVKKQAKIATKGATNRNLHLEDIQNLRLPLPKPFEQQKIAEILSTVDKKLEAERNEKARLERIKQGLMDLLLTGKVRVRL
jgi:type I restriction enzyme S subunit